MYAIQVSSGLVFKSRARLLGLGLAYRPTAKTAKLS